MSRSDRRPARAGARPAPRRRRALAGAALLAALAAGGCSDKGLTETPRDIIVADNLYANQAGFEAGVNALYGQVRRERYGINNDANNLIAEFMTAGTDNVFSPYPSPYDETFQLWNVRNNALNDPTSQLWSWLYQTVNAANTIIVRAENPSLSWSDADRDRIVGEARLIRAWAYRHLTYLFGDVPLNLDESTGSNIRNDWDRTSRDSVRRVIEADLLFAEAHLPVLGSNAGKLSRAVAQHYLAELYLATNQPAKAEEKALAVINGGQYRLVTARYGVRAAQPGVAFMDQFVDGNAQRAQGNTEALWVLQYQQNVTGGGASIMRRVWVGRYDSNRGMAVSAENGGRGIGRVNLTRYALNLYAPNDQRGGNFAIRRFYLYNNAATLPAGRRLGDTLRMVFTAEKLLDPLWPSTRKWDWTDPNDVAGAPQYNDQPYLRLAETYLLLAEAQMKQGKLAEAAASINALRRRAGTAEVAPGEVNLDLILDERSRELVTEEHRRYTLLRTGTWLDRVRRFNPLSAPNVAARDTLFAVPQAVIDANTGKVMPQNPGF